MPQNDCRATSMQKPSFVGPLQPTFTPIPIGIYGRVSTDHQVGYRFDSCEHQVQVCREYIQRMASRGWYEAGCFVDQAYSGSNMDRPGIRALMAQIAAGKIKIVLIYKLERILRSTYEWAKFSKFLEDHGCRLLTPHDDHSDVSAAGRFKTNILVTMSEYERANIAEKVVDKMRAQARRGMWSGGYIPFGYGYDRNLQQLRRNWREARIVSRIFQQAAELLPLGEIAERLNQEGYRTAQRWEKDADRNRQSVGDKPFRTDLLRKVIQNPLYRGVVRFRAEEFPGQHEALVTPEVWEQANAAIAGAKKERTPRLRPQDKYANLLKGIVVCLHCGVPLFSRASGKDRSEGKHYRYYACVVGKTLNEGVPCTLRTIAAQPLEDAIVGFLGHPELGRIASGSLGEIPAADVALRQQLTAELAGIEAELTIVQTRTQNCLDVLTEEGLQAIKPELTDRLAGLQTQKQPILVKREQYRQQLRALDEQTFNRARISHAFERLARLLPNMERERQRQLFFGLFESIQINQLKRSRDYKASGDSEQVLKLRFRIHLSNFVDAMERDVVIDDRTVRSPAYGQRLLEIEGQMALGWRGRIKIVAPFQMEIDPDADAAPVVIETVKHPIHRATKWEVELERGTSVRALALKESVSASLVSFHLKLLRLAPEIQIFVRALSTPAEVEFFSLRKLALLSEEDRETQLVRFKGWLRRFSTVTTPNAPYARLPESVAEVVPNGLS